MEDTFRVRVEKAFGSLAAFPSSNASSSLSSLWCLTDEEIERREWNRSKESPDDDLAERYPSHLDGFFANQAMGASSSQARSKPSEFLKQFETDLEELNDDEEDDDEEKERGGSSRQLVKPDDHNHEEWDIRSSVGLDYTLDYEEEEDEYDKKAAGRVKANECLYMRDLSECGIDVNAYYHEFPNSFRDVTRDSRADHSAAKIRLKEDAETAAKFDSLDVSDRNRTPLITQSSVPEDGTTLKPILKKRENQMDSKVQKRVRFEYKSDDEDGENLYETVKDSVMETSHMEEATLSQGLVGAARDNDNNPSVLEELYKDNDSADVPDYLRNASKYTHYTLESSSDIDDESNWKAHADFLNLLKNRRAMETHQADLSIELPKLVAFTPKKKPGEVSMVENKFKQTQEGVCHESEGRDGVPIDISIAGEGAQENEVCPMEEDEHEANAEKGNTFQRRSRRYRTKSSADSDEHVS